MHDDQRLEGYLQKWLNDEIDHHRAAKTAHEYRDVVNRHIVSYLGNRHLVRLTAVEVRAWQANLKRDGFSPVAQQKGLAILRTALNAAIRMDLLDRNPCAAVPRPMVVKRDIQVLTPEQCTALFAAVEGHRVGDLVVLAAMTGMRRGELCGLEWADVNLREGVLVIRRALEEVAGKLAIKVPKTKLSRRPVVLDPIAIEALRSRRRKADQESLGPDACKIVFPHNRGGYLRSSNFDRSTWYPIRAAAGLSKGFRLHDLRHTHASLLLAAGVHPKVVQERLGHADIHITLDTYSHLLAGLQAQAVEGLANLGIRFDPAGREDRPAGSHFSRRKQIRSS